MFSTLRSGLRWRGRGVWKLQLQEERAGKPNFSSLALRSSVKQGRAFLVLSREERARATCWERGANWRYLSTPAATPLASAAASAGTDTSASAAASVPLDPIPEAPLPDSVLQAVTDAAVASGPIEPPLSELGLAGWSPVGIVQSCLEYLHVGLDLPWWTAIVIGTCVVRILIFPLVIKTQRNAAKMNNNLPQMQAIQLKMTEARERGDRMDSAKYAQEMMSFMKEKNLNPLKNMLVPLAQAPIFISFFMGLRGMAQLPVESLKTGGALWFMDLTLPDQFYLLPIITSLTLLVTIEVGTDTARLSAANMGMLKYVFRALPLAIFPFTINFPAAILVYWTSTNFISLIQVSFLKIPAVRDYFKIERLVNHDKKKLPIKDKKFVESVKDSWTNMKISRELDDRQRIDEMSFMQAGRGAVRKTYKFDPTKRPIGPSVQLKKRE